MSTDNSNAQSPLSIVFQKPGQAVVTVSGDLTRAMLSPLKVTIGLAEGQIRDAATNTTGGKLSILMDISAFTGKYDVECLEAMADFARTNASYVAKTAVFGGQDTGSMAAEVAAALAGRDNIKTFATKAEAEAWLEA